MSFRERVASVLEGIQSQVSIIADIVSEVGALTKEVLYEVRSLRRELKAKAEKTKDDDSEERH